MKEQKLLTHLRKCIQDYGLIRAGDSLAVGLSGGKDSFVLLYGLKKLQAFYPVPFSLHAISVDLGFGMDYSPAAAFCEELGVPFHLEKTEIAAIIQSEDFKENPCSLCANMRRGALTNAAASLGLNKLALGHHRDDMLDTLMLSLIYEGRFYSFSPITRYEDRDIEIIRPMLTIPEAAIRSFAADHNFPIIQNLCPRDHMTKRSEMDALIHELSGRYPDLKDRLFHAVSTSEIPDWVKARENGKEI